MRRRAAAGAIVAIKSVHSAIFLVNSASVLHVFWVGVTGRRSRWTRPALAAALGEPAVFVANRGRCPLTGLAERLGAESGRVSDIFLPRWCADRIPLVCGPLLFVGLLLLTCRGRKSAAPRPVRGTPVCGAFARRVRRPVRAQRAASVRRAAYLTARRLLTRR